MNHMTRHSQQRAQQRGIPRMMIEVLQRFGRRAYDHQGGVIRYLDKKAKRDVEAYLGNPVFRRLHEYLDVYLVEAADSGQIITCGHRYSALKLH